MKRFQRNFFNESGVFNHGKSSYWSKDVSRMSHYPLPKKNDQKPLMPLMPLMTLRTLRTL